MPPTRRLNPRDEPSSRRNDDTLNLKLGIWNLKLETTNQVADDAFDAALLKCRKKMDDFHFSHSSLTQAQGLVQVLRWRPR